MAHVFGKLKHLFFGFTLDVKVVKGYHDKIKCLQDLGQLIPKRKQEEYWRLLAEVNK